MPTIYYSGVISKLILCFYSYLWQTLMVAYLKAVFLFILVKCPSILLRCQTALSLVVGPRLLSSSSPSEKFLSSDHGQRRHGCMTRPLTDSQRKYLNSDSGERFLLLYKGYMTETHPIVYLDNTEWNKNTIDLPGMEMPSTLLFFLRFYLFIFRQRGREGEREGEKHQCMVASHTPLRGTWPTTQACALTGNQTSEWPFDLQASTQSTEPVRALFFLIWERERERERHQFVVRLI